MKSTIHDVAKMAGVSVATVSRVVNGNYPVREPTRLRVQQAIDALEYVPNLQARELNTRHSFSVGIVVPSFSSMEFTGALDSIEDCLRDRSYSLLFSCAGADVARESECVRGLMRRNVSGIIVVEPNPDHFDRDFYEGIVQRIPTVFLHGGQEIPHASYLGNDERQGTMDAISHLLWMGHQRILFVKSESDPFDRVKEEAYRALMNEAGLFNDSYILGVSGGSGPEAAECAAVALAASLPSSDATGIFCCNDRMAAGAMRACIRLGKRVPEDISVMGFGNLSMGQYLTPRLTTMDRDMASMGVAAARLLLEQLDSPMEGRTVMLGTNLVKRESTGPCGAS